MEIPVSIQEPPHKVSRKPSWRAWLQMGFRPLYPLASVWAIVAVAIWVGVTGAEDLSLLKRLLPGGAATELVVQAWNGGTPIADSLLLLAPTLAWVWVAVALAVRFFRWEPRR